MVLKELVLPKSGGKFLFLHLLLMDIVVQLFELVFSLFKFVLICLVSIILLLFATVLLRRYLAVLVGASVGHLVDGHLRGVLPERFEGGLRLLVVLLYGSSLRWHLMVLEREVSKVGTWVVT